MSLTVLSVAYSLGSVGPDAVGGAEQVLTHLDRALVEAGHTSLVIALEHSRTKGRLIATPTPRGRITDDTRCLAQQHTRAAIERTIANERVDVIHYHGVDFADCLVDTVVPTLATLHLPPAWYPRRVFSLDCSRIGLNCVSDHQLRSAPDCPGMIGAIENGVDVTPHRHARRRDFALCLGRICPEKGYHVAIDAAKAADVDLLLAGQVFPYDAHVAYFTQQLLPRLDERRRFIGAVGARRRARLLSSARCLVVPSFVAETSSLVAMEAMMCGTPVVAFRSGALPEIVEHGRTGFIVNNESEMTDAIRRVALDRFHVSRMTGAYLRVYEQLAQRRRSSAPLHAAG
jgi:glycosyltransferase involved in cell wall biosynthesis